MKFPAKLALITALIPGAAYSQQASSHYVPWTLVTEAEGKSASILMANEKICTDTARQELVHLIRDDLGASASCFNPHTGEVEIFDLNRFPELVGHYRRPMDNKEAWKSFDSKGKPRPQKKTQDAAHADKK